MDRYQMSELVVLCTRPPNTAGLVVYCRPVDCGMGLRAIQKRRLVYSFLETPMVGQVAKAEMLIRRPVTEVFKAFVRPDTITKFWLESTTGPLAKAARVKWVFMVPGATETVTVTAFQEQQRIGFEWSD